MERKPIIEVYAPVPGKDHSRADGIFTIAPNATPRAAKAPAPKPPVAISIFDMPKPTSGKPKK